VKEVERLAEPVRRLLPDDPVRLARDTAEQAQAIPRTLLEPEAASEPEPAPAPQGTAAPPVGPSALAATAVVLVAAGAATAATFVGFWIAGSSGAVGSKAAASAASRLGDLRGLLPFASPLFTRFERDTVLGHPRREALYALILQEPGISLQALGDATGLSRTAVIHHLRLLERQHLVVSRRVGRSRHYFENGGRYGHDQKEAYAVLQNDRSKAVAEFIKGHPGSMQKALCAALGIQPSIAHWHVRRLEEARIVETVRRGRTVAYFPGPGLAAMQAASASAALPSAPAQPAATA
jgi:DNA-binding transcriptional ArsR family regulator